MNNLPRQIIGSFEDIGKDIVRETVKMPGDIAGMALESLGSSTTPGKRQQSSSAGKPENKKTDSVWEQIHGQSDKRAKERMAREALKYLASGKNKKPKEPTIWERIQMEAEQRKNQVSQQKTAASSQLTSPKGKRKRGDLYGAHAKQAATEKKASRQD